MPSSPTTSNRYQKTAAGEHNNTWATDLDTNLDLLDASQDGWLDIALTVDISLSSNNYAADQSRYRALHFTGTGAYTVTVPNVAKNYLIWNACTGILTLSNGTSTVALQPGEVLGVVTDGASNFKRVQPVDFGSQRITSVGSPTSNTDAATKKYVDDTAFSGTLGGFPGLTANARRVLKVNSTETNVEWGYAGLNGRRAIVGADSIIATDQEKLLAASGTFALTITAPATLGATFGCYLQNAGTGSITLTPASGLIDGLASYIMYPGEVRLLICDGSNFYTVVLNPFSKVWTTTDAGFVWPPGYQGVEGEGWGAGGGGGGGNGSTETGGGGGGGACTAFRLPASSYTAGATATITVATAAAAGAATVNGSNGGTSSVSTLVSFYGGGGGAGNSGASGAGGGVLSAAVTNTAGLPTGGQFGGAGTAGTSGGTGGPSVYGGASGGAGNAGAGGPGGLALYGGGGGAGGSSDGSTPAGGASTFGGRGGNAGATVGGAGVAPGGGGAGGAIVAGTSYAGGAGARGEVRMRGFL